MEIGTAHASTCLKDSEPAAGNATETVSGHGPGIPSRPAEGEFVRGRVGRGRGLAPGQLVAVWGGLR